MKRILIIFILIPLFQWAQLPASRQVDWTRAGSSTSLDNLPIKQVTNVVSDLNFDNTGLADVSAALNTAMSSANGNTLFYFPPGDYLFTQQVNVKSGCVIKGKSSTDTKFKFNLGSSLVHCFNINGSTSGNRVNVTGGMSKNSTSLTVSSAANFSIGDYIEIRQENDPAWWTSLESWSQNAIGQITQITNISGNNITLRDPLTYTYSSSLNPQIIKVVPKKNIGFETFYIERLDDIGDATSRANFRFNWAVECWIKGVESYKASHQHIEMGRTAFCTVSGCYFNDAFRHNNTGGAKAYGLNLIFHTNFCLFENNIFKSLRHSMSVKIGSNANVFAYNYSYSRKAQECVFGVFCSWTNDKSDMNFHGHYPFANLIEGNIVDYVHSDKTFGISGPENTLLRNRVNSSQGIFIDEVNSSVYPDYKNFLGNEIINGNYDLGIGSNQYSCSDNHSGTLKGTDCTSGITTNSLYLSGQPYFWNISDIWPSIGGSNNPGSGTIPAKYRVDQSLTLTVPSETTLCEDGSVYYDETIGRFRWCENSIWIVK